MKSLNDVKLIGNLTKDPEERALESGTTLVTFGIAMNRVWFKKDSDEKQEEVCYVNCVVWGKTGEAFAKFHRKGDPVYVSGRLQYRQYEDKDGNKRNSLEVVVEDFIIIKPYDGDDRGGSAPARSERRTERRGDDRRSSRGRRDEELEESDDVRI